VSYVGNANRSAVFQTPTHAVKSRAFTLIELLVVIAIVAILASLLLPGTGRAKEHGRSIVCMSNQKQLHMAWQLYESDTGRFPRNFRHGGFYPDLPNWAEGEMTYETELQFRPLSEATNTDLLMSFRTQLAKYLKTAAVLKCPSDQSYAIRDNIRYPRARSYSMTHWVGEEEATASGVPPSTGGGINFLTSADFQTVGPAQVFLLLDEHEDSISDANFYVGGFAGRKFGIVDLPASRHSEGANFIFCDGHAEHRRWMDKRIVKPITRIYQDGIVLPNCVDVYWIYDHSLILKQ
jgi:prepilin-type N-terminal cleavage/methylation domain-containing protein/prepilin-type processing-associated H-X9-DG protein